MSTPTSSANTTSADTVLLSYRGQIAGDCIPDTTMEEVTRRLIGEVDSTARAAQDSTTSRGTPQAASASLAVGAEELTFSWAEPFGNANYAVSLHPLGDPGAPQRIWIKSKSTTKIVFGVAGHTNAVTYSFVATP
jgi:hypothetical protein